MCLSDNERPPILVYLILQANSNQLKPQKSKDKRNKSIH